MSEWLAGSDLRLGYFYHFVLLNISYKDDKANDVIRRKIQAAMK